MLSLIIVSLIPVAAIVWRVLKSFRRAVSSNPYTYYYMMSNGATPFEAFFPYVRGTLLATAKRLIPQTKIALLAVLIGLLAAQVSIAKACLLALLIVAVILAVSFAVGFLTMEIARRRMVDERFKLKGES